MQREGGPFRAKGLTLFQAFEVALIVVVVAVVLSPVLKLAHPNPDAQMCQDNLKSLVMAMQMYWNDYDAMLPSSVLHQPQGANTWDSVASAEFCGRYGTVPPSDQQTYEEVGYVQLLWYYVRNKSSVWCPSDPAVKTRGNSRFQPVLPGPDALVSYVFKPAVDRAWFGVPDGFPVRKEGDFEYVADQVMFFERLGWHWGGHNRGWQDGISFNVGWMDGHVTAVRLQNAAGVKPVRTAAELADALSSPGEPAWYNHDALLNITDRAIRFDPRKEYDAFP